MTPSVAAGRALYLLEHPGVDPSVWDLTDEPTRDWWTAKAQPITDAVASAAWDECEAATYEIRSDPAGNAWDLVKDTPYRKAAA